jgi:chitinase
MPASVGQSWASHRQMMRMRFVELFGLVVAALIVQGAGAQGPVVVGYLPQWGMYGTPPWTAKALVTNGSVRLLDQIDYSQAAIVHGRCALADPLADVQQVYTAANSVDGRADAIAGAAAPLRGELHQLAELHRMYPRIRMVISIEGKAAAFADAAQPGKRVAFVASCLDMFLRGNLQPELGAAGARAPGLFTGIDVDWEYPNGPAAGDGSTQGANYTALLVEFRKQMDAYAGRESVTGSVADGEGAEGTVTKSVAEGKGRRSGQGVARNREPLRPLLTIAAGPGMRRYPGVDWRLVAQTVDQVGLMTYDYNGPWQKTTGMVAPLYAVAGQEGESGNIDATVQAYEAAGVPAAELLLGVPLYGYHWTGVKKAGAQHGLGMMGEPDHEDVHDAVIAQMPAAHTGSGKLFRIEPGETPWIYDGDNFWSFDDVVSARAKAQYAREQGMGGVMLWHLGEDTVNGALVKAVAAGR